MKGCGAGAEDLTRAFAPTYHDGGSGIKADASDPLKEAVSSVRLRKHTNAHKLHINGVSEVKTPNALQLWQPALNRLSVRPESRGR